MAASPISASPREHPLEDRLWFRRFFYLLAAVTAVRLVYAAVFPLDLAPDESYYWDWGRRPDWGYFSKPPMVGWLMGLAGWLGGDTQFGLKIFPVLLTSVGLTFVFLLGRAMYGVRSGFWAALVLLATPANAALSTFFTIDPPLFAAWSASLFFAWQWWTRPSSIGAAGAALVVALGCGFLTKQVQLVFPLVLVVFATIHRRHLRAGDGTRLAAMIAVSLAFLTPPLWWNWKHGWITFRHTADELEGRAWELRRSLKFLGEFIGGQAGLSGGITWLLLVAALFLAVRRWRTGETRERFLLLFSAPGLAAFLGLSLFQRVEQNWPLVFYVSAAVLLAGTAMGQVQAPRWLRPWMTAGVGTGAVLGMALMILPFVLPSTPMAGTKGDPTTRLRGWRDLAAAVERHRQELEKPTQTFLLAADDRYVASALAFYLPDRPRTYTWERQGFPESQYGIWGRPSVAAGTDALVLVRNPMASNILEIQSCFESWQRRGEIQVLVGAAEARNRTYSVFLGRGYRGFEPAKVP
ncbi:MAG: glycosyltransferase family 39 protein [Verrucomicrobiales bacterium]|nr:glycosyltransferase family 39 protein [Verrucomicrobiales bacterium]